MSATRPNSPRPERRDKLAQEGAAWRRAADALPDEYRWTLWQLDHERREGRMDLETHRLLSLAAYDTWVSRG